MAIESVDLPIEHGGSLHSYVNVPQRAPLYHSLLLWIFHYKPSILGYPLFVEPLHGCVQENNGFLQFISILLRESMR